MHVMIVACYHPLLLPACMLHFDLVSMLFGTSIPTCFNIFVFTLVTFLDGRICCLANYYLALGLSSLVQPIFEAHCLFHCDQSFTLENVQYMKTDMTKIPN